MDRARRASKQTYAHLYTRTHVVNDTNVCMLYIYRVQVDALKCVLHKALNIKLAINGQAHRINDANKHSVVRRCCCCFILVRDYLHFALSDDDKIKSKTKQKQTLRKIKLLFSKCLLDTLTECACLKEDCRVSFFKSYIYNDCKQRVNRLASECTR